MIAKDLGVKFCGVCGRKTNKFHRSYRGVEYCAACYKRDFVRKACALCGEIGRLPKKIEGCICDTCEKKKPCIRCKKGEYRIGKLTAEGPVCKSCSVYFREYQKCGKCGALSQKLSRVLRLDANLKFCPKCARSDFGTCQSCRRHRRLSLSSEGARLCPACLHKGHVACSNCGNIMPAGQGTRCVDCYHKEVLEKRIAMNSEAFQSLQVMKWFQDFGKWLPGNVGLQKAVLRINKYAEFFREVDAKFGGGGVDYLKLVSQFGASGLRKSMVPVRWMQASKLIQVDNEIKEKDSENRRILQMVAELGAFPKAYEIACEYKKELMANFDSEQASLNSVRKSLRAAVNLLRKLGSQELSQKNIDAYLRRNRGQRASIHGFVVWLNTVKGMPVALHKRKTRKYMEWKMAEQRVKEMIQSPWGVDQKEGISVGLQYFHKLRKKFVEMEAIESVEGFNEGLMVGIGGNRYWLPLQPIVNHTGKQCRFL